MWLDIFNGVQHVPIHVPIRSSIMFLPNGVLQCRASTSGWWWRWRRRVAYCVGIGLTYSQTRTASIHPGTWGHGLGQDLFCSIWVWLCTLQTPDWYEYGVLTFFLLDASQGQGSNTVQVRRVKTTDLIDQVGASFGVADVFRTMFEGMRRKK